MNKYADKDFRTMSLQELLDRLPDERGATGLPFTGKAVERARKMARQA